MSANPLSASRSPVIAVADIITAAKAMQVSPGKMWRQTFVEILATEAAALAKDGE